MVNNYNGLFPRSFQMEIIVHSPWPLSAQIIKEISRAGKTKDTLLSNLTQWQCKCIIPEIPLITSHLIYYCFPAFYCSGISFLGLRWQFHSLKKYCQSQVTSLLTSSITLENRANACSNLHIWYRPSALITIAWLFLGSCEKTFFKIVPINPPVLKPCSRSSPNPNHVSTLNKDIE